MRHLLLLLATRVLAGVGHAAPVLPTSADKVFDGLFGAEPARVAGTRTSTSINADAVADIAHMTGRLRAAT